MFCQFFKARLCNALQVLQDSEKGLVAFRSRLVRGPVVDLEIDEDLRRYALGAEVTIGRGDATIVIGSKAVSRRHLRIGRSPEGAFVEDLDTRNGTLLAGARIAGRIPVGDGLRLVLGGGVPCAVEPICQASWAMTYCRTAASFSLTVSGFTTTTGGGTSVSKGRSSGNDGRNRGWILRVCGFFDPGLVGREDRHAILSDRCGRQRQPDKQGDAGDFWAGTQRAFRFHATPFLRLRESCEACALSVLANPYQLDRKFHSERLSGIG